MKSGNNKLTSAGGISTQDIHNSASYSAESSQVTMGTSAGSSSAGFGNDSGSAASTTRAGISGIAGNTAARTGDAETGIQKIFNQQAVAENVNAQVQITQTAGQQVPKATANAMDKQAKDLIAQASAETDGTKKQALLSEADKYKEGGIYRIAAHTLFGALSGGAGGAAAAGTVAANAQNLNNLQDQLAKSLQEAGVGEKTAKAIANVTFNAGALVASNAVGGGAGAAAALNVDANNRQLHPTEIQWIKSNASKFAKQLSKDLGREVSTQEAIVWLTAAGESDVDANAQRSNGMFVRGTSNTEEAQAYGAAKAFIATGTKKDSGFIDANGQSQTLFTAKNGDFYKPQVYSEYRNDPQYRDYYWNVMGINLKGDNMSPQEKAVYEQRQVIANKETAKQLLTLGVQVIAGKVASGVVAKSETSPSTASTSTKTKPTATGKPDAMLPDSELLTNKPSGLNETTPIKDIFGKAPNTSTLNEHLATGGPSVKTVSGAHSESAYKSELASIKGVEVAQPKALAPGITEYTYNTPDRIAKGQAPLTKTTYDSTYTDAQILGMSKRASSQAWTDYQKTGVAPTPDNPVIKVIDGVPFKVNFSKDKTGIVTVYSHPGDK